MMIERKPEITGYRRVKLHDEARVSPMACVIGDVTLGKDVTVLPNASIRGDYGESIVVGEGTNVQEGASLHVDLGSPLRIGKRVIIGHNATVHGCTIDDGALIGMGAIIMNGAHVGEGAVIGAGALVPEGKVVEPFSVMVGLPAKQVRMLTEEERRINDVDAQTYIDLGKQMEADGIVISGANMPHNIPNITVADETIG